MLPAGMAREIHGQRKRRAVDFTSQDTQLVGRSRSERLLDGIFNRQSKHLRAEEAHRRREEAKLRLIALRVKRAAEDELKVEDVKRMKVERQQVDVSTAANGLIKHVSSKAKFPKVVQLAHQLFESSFCEEEKDLFLTLATALALSPHCALIPEARVNVIKLFELINSKFSPTPAPPTEATPAPTDSATPDSFESTVKLNQWLEVLSVPALVHTKLFTDDTFQFLSALSKITKKFEQLPTLSQLPTLQTGQESQSGEGEAITLELFLSALQARAQASIDAKKEASETLASKIKEEPSPDPLPTPDPSNNGSAQPTPAPQTFEPVSPLTSTDAPSPRPTETETQHRHDNESNNPTPTEKASDKKDKTSIPLDSPQTEESSPQTGACNSAREASPREAEATNHQIETNETHATELQTPTKGRPSDVLDDFDEMEDGMENEMEENLPTRFAAVQIERQFILKCLQTVAAFAHTKWARAAVVGLFQKVYFQRHKKFPPSECVLIESLQSQIHSATSAEKRVGAVLLMGEAANPVRDGREEKLVASHGASVWNAKQTGL